RDQLEKQYQEKPDLANQDWFCETLAGAYLGLAVTASTCPRAGQDSEQTLFRHALTWARRAIDRKRDFSAVQHDPEQLWLRRRESEWQLETTYADWLRVAFYNEPEADETAYGAADYTFEMGDAQLQRQPLFVRYWLKAAEVLHALRSGPPPSWKRIASDARRGKVGLALSGGGFRASFFHLGVL